MKLEQNLNPIGWKHNQVYILWSLSNNNNNNHKLNLNMLNLYILFNSMIQYENIFWIYVNDIEESHV